MTQSLPLADLQASVQDRAAFTALNDYHELCSTFLRVIEAIQPTRIISPSHPHYIFYQYSADYEHRLTRPLNTNLFLESPDTFHVAFERFVAFLSDLKRHQQAVSDKQSRQQYIESNAINSVVYTVQQAIGCVGDSFRNPNQARKRIGQLFENLIKLIIQNVGFECESRTIQLPVPSHPGYEMSYELDLVFSRSQVILAAEDRHLHPAEIVGSVKTTSKDRLDKIFLDKHMLTRLIGREVPVVAVFLHDVQRARRGRSIFGINSTFKTNHFLGYTVALNRLDGVYYVDPRPEMVEDPRLREHIGDFRRFLIRDLWLLSEI